MAREGVGQKDLVDTVSVGEQPLKPGLLVLQPVAGCDQELSASQFEEEAGREEVVDRLVLAKPVLQRHEVPAGVVTQEYVFDPCSCHGSLCMPHAIPRLVSKKPSP